VKKITKLLMAVIFLFVVIYTFYSKPTHVEKELEGIAFTLGDHNTYVEASTLKMIGFEEKTLFGKYLFDGTVVIDGHSYHLIFEGAEHNLLTYSSDAGYTRIFGDIYLNQDGSKISIRILENGWSSQDGKMLAYPCKTREEGLEISRDIVPAILE